MANSFKEIRAYITPHWLQMLTDMVRPGGVALMFLVITILPILFAILEVGVAGLGIKMATVLASYFKAVPDIYYNTLQIMFGVYVAGKSGEKIATTYSAAKAKSNDTTINADEALVEVDQRTDAKG